MPVGRDEQGTLWEFDGIDANGDPINPRPVKQAGSAPQQGAVYAPPPDPYKQAAEARAQQDQALQVQRFQFDQAKAARELNKPTATDQQLQADKQNRVRALNSLVDQINRTQELGNAGPLASQGMLSAVSDYLPTAANKRFDTSGAQLSQQGLAAFRVPGTGTVSDRDAMMFDRGNLPQASNMDAQNEEILLGLRRRVENEYESLGLPKPQWVSPLNQAQPEGPANVGAQGSMWNATFGTPRTREERNPGLEKQVRAAFLRGANYEQLSAITESAGYGPINAMDYARAEEARKKGQAGGVSFTVKKAVPLSRFEEAAGSSTGAVGIGLGNAGSFGLVKRFAPDQYAEAENMNGGSMLGGEVLGAITGTGAIGKLGTGVAGRMGTLGQKLLQGGGRAGNLARGVGTDVAYSAAYGAGSGDGVAESALAGGVGSLGGRAVGKVLGKGIGGLTRAPGAQELADRGIPLTVGQNMGGMLKGIEDRAAGYPIIGDIIGNRRLEGMQGFNQAAFNDAGQPIGAQISNTGEQGLNDLMQATSGAYDSATAGMNVPLDAQFMPDLAQVAQQSRNLPPDLAQRFNAAMDNRVQPIAQSGQMTGETYQQGMRGLSGYKAEMTKPGFEGDYRDALSGAQDVLKSQMMRGGGASVVEGLGKADRSYRLTKVLQDAVSRAKNGTGSGEIQTFTPAQLNMSAAANAKKFGGQRPFASLIDAGQQVLPSKIPDSGTAGRLAQLALPGFVAGGAGTGYATGGEGGAATGGIASLGLLAALAAGGTKGGQKAINKLLFDRPAALRGPKARRAIGKLQGLFGAASVPLALESGN